MHDIYPPQAFHNPSPAISDINSQPLGVHNPFSMVISTLNLSTTLPSLWYPPSICPQPVIHYHIYLKSLHNPSSTVIIIYLQSLHNPCPTVISTLSLSTALSLQWYPQPLHNPSPAVISTLNLSTTLPLRWFQASASPQSFHCSDIHLQLHHNPSPVILS